MGDAPVAGRGRPVLTRRRRRARRRFRARQRDERQAPRGREPHGAALPLAPARVEGETHPRGALERRARERWRRRTDRRPAQPRVPRRLPAPRRSPSTN